MHQNHAELIHTAPELFSKEMTGWGEGRQRDVRVGTWWITFENIATRHEFLSSLLQTANCNFTCDTEICQKGGFCSETSARLQHLSLLLLDSACHVCTLLTWQTSCVCLKHCSPVWNSATQFIHGTSTDQKATVEKGQLSGARRELLLSQP